MNRLCLFLATLALIGSFGSVHAAATLTRVDGGVRVNQGTEFVEAYELLPLQTGDRIMTLQDGRIIVTFDDGCEIEAGPNTLITVPDTSTCAGGIAPTQNIAPGGTEAVGAGGSSNWRTALYIALPVAIAAAVIIERNDDDPTVSP
jgi:hypothetical protein